MRIIMLGPPGVGKGTQAERVARRLVVPHIATGDILRKNVAEGTALGKKAESFMKAGGLVPDDVIIEMMRHRLSETDALKGFVLDGYPRTYAQAEALDKSFDVDVVINIYLEPEDLVKRSTGRRVCDQCQSIYHLLTNPPKVEGRCDECGGQLIQRVDDREDVVRKRIETYDEKTRPLIEYYRRKGLLRQVYGGGLIDEVLHRVLECLG